MNTIIAATDYTEIAENAVEYAAAIAKLKNERLILMNDIEESIHAENARLSAGRFDALMEENKTRLRQRASSLSEKYGIDVLPKSTNSFVENELANLIDEYQVYMVVMGMASGSRFQELWGNTTTSVIKNLPVNVLAVPAGAKFEGLKKVLFACDALHEVSEALLNRIKNIGLILPAEVEVLFISTDPRQAQETSESSYSLKTINDRLEGISHHYENVSADSIVEGIRMEVIRSNADLLIMAPQKHGFWDSLVHRSKTRLMASGLDIPLLSVRL
jgi:nucleotide-binding universal stress UspA family protein